MKSSQDWQRDDNRGGRFALGAWIALAVLGAALMIIGAWPR